jgi:aspartyl-tRNA(Asn)/glutamyl-tRNA(Gln) amidotransferase subunit A
VPLTGALPLSASYDSIGPLAKTVEMCARVYAVLSGSAPDIQLRRAKYLRIGVIRNYVLEALDASVSSTYASVLTRLSRAGVDLIDVSLPVLEGLPALFANGWLVAAEAYEWHRELLEVRGAEYDPRVSVRIRRGSLQTAADYIKLKQLRGGLIAQWAKEIESFDAVVMPTVPLIAPMLSELGDEERYSQTNLLMLRNPTVVNALASLVPDPVPLPRRWPGGAAARFRNGNDWKLLSIAAELGRVL